MAKAKTKIPIRNRAQIQPIVRDTTMNRATCVPRAGSPPGRER
jgi:hypothetical protein